MGGLVEGQFYITTIAGLGVSLAGFSALLTLFRQGQAWDAVTLWRARAIVRTSIETAFSMLTTIPVFYLAGSEAWAIRTGSFFLLVSGVSDSIRMGPRREPAAWPDRRRAIPFYVIGVVSVVILGVNLFIANLGIFLALGLWNLGLPMTIFMAVLEEFRPRTGGDDPAVSPPI
jgi:hypothetical protein